MKKLLNLIFVILLFISFKTFASYPIGHQALTYTDASRSNRSITTDIYYPATSAGETTPIASGQFPVIVFGHGFVMGDDAYVYFKDTMTSRGYIVIFPTTESGMSPSHPDFGLDIAYMINKIKSEGTSSSSFFYNHISSQSAVMGHSMGGGSSFLACKNNTIPTCIVTFAAANTTPSSITAAQSVTIPVLVISGSVDCVASPSTNQIPMYDSLASDCKVFISVKNGCHCYFGDANTMCTFGESTCDATPPLSRSIQHSVTLDFVKLYLDYYLKNNSSSWTIFNDSLNSSPRITFKESCTITGTSENINSLNFKVSPNPSNNLINVDFNSYGSFTLSVVDIIDKNVLNNISGNSIGYSSQSIDISRLQNGMYILTLSSGNKMQYKKFIKN